MNERDADELRSPIFPDGTFEFVPIREGREFASSDVIPTYGQLHGWTGRAMTLADYVEQRIRSYRVHADPEFETFTYGDVRTSRSANLRLAVQGDQLWFLARLWDHDGTDWTGSSAFYLIGYYVVADNVEIAPGTAPDALAPAFAQRIARNAHYRRMLAGERTWCRIIVGDLALSRRFRTALRVTPEVAGLVYGGRYDPATRAYVHNNNVLLNRNGKPRSFDTFGSVTRTIQPFLDSQKDGEYFTELHGHATKCSWVDAPTAAATRGK